MISPTLISWGGTSTTKAASMGFNVSNIEEEVTTMSRGLKCSTKSAMEREKAKDSEANSRLPNLTL